MKSVLARAAVAALFFAAGGAVWTAGQVERRVGAAHQELAALRYASPAAEYDDLEQSMGYAGSVPWLTEDIVTDIRQHRATAQYWLTRYGTLAPKRDANGALVEKDPALLFHAANAAYRASQREGGDRQGKLRRLDGVIQSYADVLKAGPGHADAAYNYEYVVRMRDALAKTRQGTLAERPAPRADDGDTAEDLPTGPTLHGWPGGPPPGTDMSQFKMVIPLRKDERREMPEAGKGQKKVRKG